MYMMSDRLALSPVKEIDNEESLYSPPSTMIDRKEAHKALYVRVVIIMMDFSSYLVYVGR